MTRPRFIPLRDPSTLTKEQIAALFAHVGPVLEDMARRVHEETQKVKAS